MGPVLIVSFMCLVTLSGSVHLKTQPYLPAFWDCLCAGEDLHQWLQIEILGFSQTFPVDASSLDLWVQIPTEKGFAGFFFQELVISCSLWCLSALLWVPWSCSKLFCSFLFSANPRRLDYVRSPQCSETGDTETRPSGGSLRTWDIGHILQHFLSSGRSQEFGIFSHSFFTELWRRAMASE